MYVTKNVWVFQSIMCAVIGLVQTLHLLNVKFGLNLSLNEFIGLNLSLDEFIELDLCISSLFLVIFIKY